MLKTLSSNATSPILREKIRDEVIARHDAIADKLARRYTRGNVNVKRGAYLTRKDLDNRANKKKR